MTRCKKCGTELPEDAKFCSICGTPTEYADHAECVAAQENTSAAEAAATMAGTAAAAAGAQNGAQMNQGQQFANGAQMNQGQQFSNGAQMNQGQQFANGAQFRQAAPKETAASYYAKQPYMPPADDATANKGVAICGYFGLLWIVPLITAKHSPFAKFHANQALMVFLTSIAAWIVSGILKLILFAIFSWRAYAVVGFISFAVGVFSLVLMIVGIVFAAQGKMKEIPVIGQLHIIK